jgi:hypothetical protein
MGLHHSDLPAEVLGALRQGAVIPAHPLALKARRELDLRRQRALSRYYIDAGVSGLAVGVHTTQFAIRAAGLYEPVLRTAVETAAEWADRPLLLVAGLVGRTEQALREADTALALGYHAGLLSLAALEGASEDELIAHCTAVARRIPVIGFYLQSAVGGIVLAASFWRRFAALDNVIAIKIAPFNRYHTLDVVRGVVEAGAEERITRLTGNDDHIVLDLLTPFRFRRGDQLVTAQITGGLLGHWCVWTRRVVELVARARQNVAEGAIATDAEQAGVTYCIEPLAPSETPLINTVEEAAELALAIGSPAVRTMIDTCAAGNAESIPIPELIGRWLRTGHVAHIHLNDPNRRAPGQGTLRFAPILAALHREGYRGLCSIEPFVYEPDGPTCAARAIGYVRGLLEAIER